MALNLYTDIKQIPAGMELIEDNEYFFGNVTIAKLEESCEFILQEIEHAGVDLANRRMIDKRGRSLYLSMMSTGCKTALNVFYNVDKCFPLLECGGNAIDTIYQLNSGNVYITSVDLFMRPNHVNMVYATKSIKTFGELCKLYEEVWPDAYSPDRNYL